MAQNEMKAKPALPERVRSMEGLGVNVALRMLIVFWQRYLIAAAKGEQILLKAKELTAPRSPIRSAIWRAARGWHRCLLVLSSSSECSAKSDTS